MSEQEKIIDHFTQMFKDFESQLNGQTLSPLHAFRKKSIEALQKVQFPDRRHEDWKYTGVQQLIAPAYKLAEAAVGPEVPSIPDLDSYVITFENGRLVEDKTDRTIEKSGVRILPLHQALQEPTWVSRLESSLDVAHPTSGQAFHLLNVAFHTQGFVLDIPKNTIVDKPIELRFIHTDAEVSFSNPLYLIYAAEGSDCTLIERYDHNPKTSATSSPCLINTFGHIFLEKNAGVRHIKWQDLPAHQSLVYALHVSQSADSRFNSFAIDFGGRVVRNNIDVELNESNTYTSLQAAFMARGNQSMDHQTKINHSVPHCESHELYRGILDEKAVAAFNGKVFVHQDAQKTNAYQQNDTMVLSTYALMNSKPQLEIFADDVRCSHGATIGQLDRKSLFYLMARGLDETTATHMLKAAFLAQVLDAIPVAALGDYIRTRMSINL